MNLPELPYDAWTNPRHTLHLILQIIGKIRLCLSPRKNHWWYITLYVSPRGLTTGPVPYKDGYGSFEIEADLMNHRVTINTSEGDERVIALRDGRSVADFFEHFTTALRELGVGAHIVARPYDIAPVLPFSRIEDFKHYDPDYADRYRRILIWVDGVMKEFSGRFYGKTSPVQLFWHHMDLAVTRFSGRRAPAIDPGAQTADKDAYSHEVVSFGFWAGDEALKEPAFYSYAHPLPEAITEMPLTPAAAAWENTYGSPMAILRYEDIRMEADPRKNVLEFFESSYQAGAVRAGWDIDDLTVPDLDAL